MIQEPTFQDDTDIDSQLIHFIQCKMSLIEIMSERLDLEKEIVLDHIQKLLEEGKVHGRVSSDNSRFFRSDVKMPTKSDGSIEDTAVIDELISKLPTNQVTGPKCNKGHIGRKIHTM
ncbi:MAG: hypothetical protein ACW97A_12205 [Candidatus Thorarchaeota archaeon]|jgi:hypothetical protein